MAHDWDALRAQFDSTGMQAIEQLVADGKVSREVAGQRVAKFNDMVIDNLKAMVAREEASQ